MPIKPIAMTARIINNSSHAGDAVLDLYSGFGTTLMAAEQCGRVCYTIEQDPKCCDSICKRYMNWQQNDSGVFLLRDGKRTPYHEMA